MKTTAKLHLLGFYFAEDFYKHGEPASATLELPASATGEQEAEDAFRYTNDHRLSPVFLNKNGFCSSLSVGDVVELPDRNEFYLCVGSGWMKINKSELNYLTGKKENQFEWGGTRFDVGMDGPKAIEARRARHAEAAAR